MQLCDFNGFRFIDGGVCASKGFKANGVCCGINPTRTKNDLALIVGDKMCNVAAVYTSNKLKGAPIIVTRDNIKNGKARAVIANSVNANTCNADGEKKAMRMCEVAARGLEIEPSDVIVASTGVIGQILPIEPIENGISALVEGLSEDGYKEAVNAIMTTDTMAKEVAVEFLLGKKLCKLGGMLKGSGMIHPNMATTLTFLTTDVDITPELLNRALKDIVNVTLNRVSVDGDTSTNDMCCIMASGMTDAPAIKAEDIYYETFKNALYVVLMNLARMMARDGEGATKLIECVCSGADCDRTAEIIGKSVITSSLFKTAMFGEDANWGRILCAIGYAEAEFDINKVDVDIASASGKIEVCREGTGVDFSEEAAKMVLSEEVIQILINIGDGNGKAVCWGCDLTYDYVKINGDYRS